MPSKKPSSPPSTVAKTTPPAPGRKNRPAPLNPRQQADKGWQRSKRYGWDSR